MARGRRSMRSRRTRRGRKMRGGWQQLNPATVDDTSMQGPTKMSNAQGQEYQALHEGQHGGAHLGEGAPVGDTGMLDHSLRTFARVTPLDSEIGQIAGMRDQSGGRRRSRRRSRSSKRKHRGSRRKHGGSRRKHGGSRRKHGGRRRKNGGRRSRKQRGGKMQKDQCGGRRRKHSGGAVLNPAGSELDSRSAMILDSRQTESGMNPEWKLAHNPSSMAPSM